jgi:hypothetical protein
MCDKCQQVDRSTDRYQKIAGAITKVRAAQLVSKLFLDNPAFGVTVSLSLNVLAYLDLMQDRRATPRQRVFKAASIEFDDAKIDCTIRNLSHSGAALDVLSPVCIPHEITVKMIARQTRHHGYVVWRRDRRVGIVFAR